MLADGKSTRKSTVKPLHSGLQPAPGFPACVSLHGCVHPSLIHTRYGLMAACALYLAIITINNSRHTVFLFLPYSWLYANCPPPIDLPLSMVSTLSALSSKYIWQGWGVAQWWSLCLAYVRPWVLSPVVNCFLTPVQLTSWSQLPLLLTWVIDIASQ